MRNVKNLQPSLIHHSLYLGTNTSNDTHYSTQCFIVETEEIRIRNSLYFVKTSQFDKKNDKVGIPFLMNQAQVYLFYCN